jgi:hypothetical protein
MARRGESSTAGGATDFEGLCGYGSDCHELVMLAVQPSIDVCRTCQRLSSREFPA